MSIRAILRCFCCTRTTEVEEIQKPSRETTLVSQEFARTLSELNGLHNRVPHQKARLVFPPENLAAGHRQRTYIHQEAPLFAHRRTASPSPDSNSQFLEGRGLSHRFEAHSNRAQSINRSPRVQENHLFTEVSAEKPNVQTESSRAKSDQKTSSISTERFQHLRPPQKSTMVYSTGSCELSKWAIATNKKSKDAGGIRAFVNSIEIIFKEKEYTAKFFAICNGANGATAVEYIKENLAINLQLALQEMMTNFGEIAGISDVIVYNSLRIAFANTDKFFNANMSDQQSKTGVSGILVIQGQLWPINLGEASVLLCNHGISYQLTNPANPTGLNLQPAQVEKEPLPGALPTLEHPIQTEVKRGPPIYLPIPLSSLGRDHFIVIASKGINSVGNPLKLLEEIHEHNATFLVDKACNIVDSTISTETTENCTAVVIQLNLDNRGING